MESTQTEQTNTVHAVEQKPWHKPEVSEITVSLGTNQKSGSFEDGEFGASFPPPP